MTDTENLRKFLESDDPAMVRMGISMAKGAGVPDELNYHVLAIAKWDPEKENQDAAEEMVAKIEQAGWNYEGNFDTWKEEYKLGTFRNRLEWFLMVLQKLGFPFPKDLKAMWLRIGEDDSLVDGFLRYAFGASSLWSGEGYCVRCKHKRMIQNMQGVVMKNGRMAAKGICGKCGTGMYRIMPQYPEEI